MEKEKPTVISPRVYKRHRVIIKKAARKLGVSEGALRIRRVLSPFPLRTGEGRFQLCDIRCRLRASLVEHLLRHLSLIDPEAASLHGPDS